MLTRTLDARLHQEQLILETEDEALGIDKTIIVDMPNAENRWEKIILLFGSCRKHLLSTSQSGESAKSRTEKNRYRMFNGREGYSFRNFAIFWLAGTKKLLLSKRGGT